MSKYLVITRDYLLPVTLILSLVVGWWICFHTSAFTVREIICELDYEPCDNPFVMAELDKYAGINLLTLDTNSLRDKLLSGDYTVRQAEITRALPARLTVSMQSVYPVAAISHLGVEGEWVTVDSRFRIIGLRREDHECKCKASNRASSRHQGGTTSCEKHPARGDYLDYNSSIRHPGTPYHDQRLDGTA